MYIYNYGKTLRFARTRNERPGKPRWRWWWWWWWQDDDDDVADDEDDDAADDDDDDDDDDDGWHLVEIPIRNPNDCMVNCSMGPGDFDIFLKPYKKP